MSATAAVVIMKQSLFFSFLFRFSAPSFVLVKLSYEIRNIGVTKFDGYPNKRTPQIVISGEINAPLYVIPRYPLFGETLPTKGLLSYKLRKATLQVPHFAIPRIYQLPALSNSYQDSNKSRN